MEPPGTAPGSDPLITSAFMSIVPKDTSKIGRVSVRRKGLRLTYTCCTHLVHNPYTGCADSVQQGVQTMCNLYSLTTTQSAIADLVNLWRDDTGNLPAMPAIYPDYPAPVITQEDGSRVLRMMRWGMPSPAFALKGKKTDKGVTNVRNTSSPHWRRWLGPAHRCVVPFTSFSEYKAVKGGPPEVVWFAPTGEQKTLFFAGIWTEWTSVRKLKEGEVTADLFAFLTVEPNAVVAPIHPKAMPVILRSADAVEHWLTASPQDALRLQRPFADDGLRVVDEAV